MLIFTLYLLLLLIVLGIFFYFSTKPNTSNKSKLINTANIQIEVENQQIRKTRAIEENEVIREAESHFKSLALKNPYSPLPFKVLAEFYIKNGLRNEAIKKCEQMTSYLNKELDLIKLAALLQFLVETGREDLVEKINSFYSIKG